MTTVRGLPFDADTPDDFLVPYANGSLTPSERDEVERWLAGHPEWRARLEAYRAIGSAVRQAAASSSPPALSALPDLWAALEARPPPQPVRSLPPPPPPPYPTLPPYAELHARRPRRGPGAWLLAAAAVVLVALAAASVVIVGNRDSGDLSLQDAGTVVTDPTAATDPSDDAPSRTTAGEDDAPSAPSGGVEARQALRDGATATSDQQTAHTAVRAVGTVDLTGNALGDLVDAEEITVNIRGTGEVEFPDRSKQDTTTAIIGGTLTDTPGEEVSTVEIGERVWVACDGETEYTEVVADVEPSCSSLDVGTSFFGPDAAIDLLERAEGDVIRRGRERINGERTTRYQLTMSFDPDDSGVDVPVTIDVWIGDDDGLIHQVRAVTEFMLPLDVLGTTYELPTTLDLTFVLEDFGEPVDIPDLD